MIQLWHRLKGGVTVVLADNTTPASEDPSTGHGEIHAAIALSTALSFRAIGLRTLFSRQVEQDRALLEELLTGNSHLVCLGGPDTNVVTEALLERYKKEGRDVPVAYSRDRYQDDPPGTLRRHALRYREEEYHTGYVETHPGDPHRMTEDYGVVLWWRMPKVGFRLDPRTRWALISMGCHTYGTHAGIAALANPRCGGTISRLVGGEEFDCLVKIEDLMSPEHPVRVLRGSDPAFAEGDDFFLNSADMPLKWDPQCVGRLTTGWGLWWLLAWLRIRRFFRLLKSDTHLTICRRRVSLPRGESEEVFATLAEATPVAAETFEGIELEVGTGGWRTIARKLRELRAAEWTDIEARLSGLSATFAEDVRWGDEHPAALRPLTGRWVAIKNQRIVASGLDQAELLRELHMLGLSITGHDRPHVRYVGANLSSPEGEMARLA